MDDFKMEKHNVNQCVKLCEQYMADCGSGIPEQVSLIPDENRIKSLRRKSLDSIAKTLDKWSENIHSGIEQKYGAIASIETGNADNKTAADLAVSLESGMKLDIELKFGSETNSNIGLATFERLFGISLEMPCDVRNQWFEQVYVTKEKTEDEWHSFFKEYYNGKIDPLNQSYEGKTLNEEQTNFLVNSILNSSGSPTGNGSEIVKFALKQGRMTMVEPIETRGAWIGTRTNSIVDPLKNRLNFAIEDDEHRVTFILNWKNTYRKNGIAVPAKYGFGSASLNIFARSKKSKKGGKKINEK